MSLNNVNKDYIKRIVHLHTCGGMFSPPLGLVADIIEHRSFNLENVPRKTISKHHGTMCSKSRYLTSEGYQLSVEDQESDTWIYRLAMSFSVNGEPDFDKAVECINLLVSKINYNLVVGFPHQYVDGDLNSLFKKPHKKTYLPLDNFLQKYPMRDESDLLETGNFDEYRIEQLYPALYELLMEKDCFSHIYKYRETVPEKVKDFIDYALYYYVYRDETLFRVSPLREQYGYGNTCTAYLLMNVIRPQCTYVALYRNSLIVRKGTKLPEFQIGNRKVSAKFHKTHNNVMLSTSYSSYIRKESEGTIFKEWDFSSMPKDFGLQYIYGIDDNDEFKIVESYILSTPESNASFKTRYIFSPVRSMGRADMDVAMMAKRLSEYTSGINRLMESVDNGLDLDEFAEAMIMSHNNLDCECNSEIEKFARVMS